MGKHTKRVITALLLVWAIGAVGCGKPGSSSQASSPANSPTASTGGTVSTIQQKIKADSDLAKQDIKATEQGGTISLDGTVVNQDQKDKAEKIVLDTQKELKQQPGVLNNLMFKEAGSSGTAPAGG
jgi:ABC-type glycerol-3-phosphate transport system substrate-binding protein